MNQTNSQFELIFIIPTAVMLTMAIVIILFVLFYQKKMLQEEVKRHLMEAEFQRRMLRAALDSQENERRRLAADLHDSIGAMLSAIRMGLATMGRKGNIDDETISPTKQMLDDTIKSVRAISHDLMPSTLEKFGLSQALEEMCQRIQGAAKLPVLFKESGESAPLEKSKEVMLFRVVQELLNNAIKHSEATELQVGVYWEREMLTLSVTDNGKGFNYDKQKDEKGNSKGLGLYNIENRTRLMGATVKYETPEGGGSKFSIRVQLEK